MRTTREQRETYRQIVATHAGALTLDESIVLSLLDDADEADAMRAVLHSIATLDEADTDDLVEALTNRHQAADGWPFTAGWTPEAPVLATSYSGSGGSVTTWHPTRAEAEAAVDERLRADGVVLP